MKRYSLLLIAMASVLLLQAQTKDQPYQTKSLANESIKNVEVETSGGSISVAGVSNTEARIEVYIRGNNGKENNLTKEEIQKRLSEDYQLTISVSNNKLTAIAKPKDRNMNWKKALSISFKIFSPKAVSTDLATSGGSIDLKDITGTQDFTTSGGSLHIENVGGVLKGRTSGGSIDVKDSKDKIDLSTSGGSIHASNCNGNLKLATSGGSLKLEDLKGQINASTSGGSVTGNTIQGELTAHTSGGNVKLQDLSCSLEASTSGGHIDVEIKEFGKYVTITNSGGNIDLQIPPNKGIDLKLRGDKINTTTLTNFNGSVEEDEITGKLNGGGIPVTVKASSGRIKLAMK
jgi:hypothetical protein